MIMTLLSKIQLTVAAGGLTLGSFVADYGDNANPLALTAALPLGAIAFGMFLIAFALQKEVAIYDREQAMKMQAPQRDTAPALKKKEISSQPTAVQLKEKTV
jgi:hypothetical protein